MFSVKSVLVTAAVALISGAEAVTFPGYGLISIRSGSPVHLLPVTSYDWDGNLYLNHGDAIAGDITIHDYKTHGFDIHSMETKGWTPWLTIESDGRLAYEKDTTDGIPGEWSGWNWTTTASPTLAYNGINGAIACLNSTGVAQLYFDLGDDTFSCPNGATAYGVDLMRTE
ncbi:hypothetical protein RUND412_008330 [Rhizina undulata]